MESLGLAVEETNYRHAMHNFHNSCDLRQGNTIKVKGERAGRGRWRPLDLNNWEEDAATLSGHCYSDVAKEEAIRDQLLESDSYLLGKVLPKDLSLPMIKAVGTYHNDRLVLHSETPKTAGGGGGNARRASTRGSAAELCLPSIMPPASRFTLSPATAFCGHAREVKVSPLGALTALEDALATMQSTSDMPGCYVNSSTLLEAEKHKRTRDKLMSHVDFTASDRSHRQHQGIVHMKSSLHKYAGHEAFAAQLRVREEFAAQIMED